MKESLKEYARGMAGGLMFSLPLLYTMEVWFYAFVASPLRLLIALGVTFVLLLGYNRFAGMHPDATWIEVAIDSVEELGLGLVTAALVLFLAAQIGTESSFNEVIAKVTLEGMLVAIGFSVGTAQLGAQGEERRAQEGQSGSDKKDGGVLAQVVLAICGAVLVAGNVAPTEEIVMIGVEASPAKLLGMVALSGAIAVTVQAFSAFRGAKPYVERGSIPPLLFGAVVSYAVALAVSAGLLYFFFRFEDTDWTVNAAQTVVLALPGALGASAGRFLLQME